MPDIRAYLALLAFVPISLAVLAAVPKDRSIAAIFGVYIGGLLTLPENAAFDLPLLPPMDKNGFSGAMALLGAVVLQRRRVLEAKPLRGVDVFFWIMVLGNVGTAMTNGDVLVFGEDFFKPTGEQVGNRRVLPALGSYDIVSMVVRDFLSIYVPFLLGRALFRTAEDAEVMMKGFVIACLLYIPLMLVEMRLSPQIHNWTYGYAPSGMIHAARGDGYKPVVYLHNGLAVAMLLVAGVISAAVLHKRKVNLWGMPMVVPLGLIWLMLGLSRNMGATVYSLLVVPVLLLSRGKLASTASILLALGVLAYPFVRGFEMIDTEAILAWIEGFAPDRARSLGVRFTNEDMLWDRAMEREWFGWGGFGRNRIYDKWGKDVSITDGEWIIRVGGRGFIGWAATFGLLLAPIFIARANLAKLERKNRIILDGFSLLVAINAVDLLPNSLFTQMPFLVAGGLIGLSRGIASDPRKRP